MKLTARSLVALVLVSLSPSPSLALDCFLKVPNNPLTAHGLTTPYLLSGPGCDQATAGSAAFIQGAIIDLDTGKIYIYNPLVINQGSTAAILPLAPQIISRNITALWFGFNGNTLTITNDAGIRNGDCRNGTTKNSQTVFGQFSYCNAPAFFQAAENAILLGQLVVPPLGQALDGKNCPTTRDWAVVDQDQSDNVVTSYLVINGKLAQDSAANRRANPGAIVLANGSDNRLLDIFILPALGCSPWMAPDLANNNILTPALPLNEILAQFRQNVPQALVPVSDPMVQQNGVTSVPKTNLYRVGVFQPTISFAYQASGQAYCQNLRTLGLPRILANKNRFLRFPTPDAAAGATLFRFLLNRFKATLVNLNCPSFGISFDAAAVDDNVNP